MYFKWLDYVVWELNFTYIYTKRWKNRDINKFQHLKRSQEWTCRSKNVVWINEVNCMGWRDASSLVKKYSCTVGWVTKGLCLVGGIYKAGSCPLVKLRNISHIKGASKIINNWGGSFDEDHRHVLQNHDTIIFRNQAWRLRMLCLFELSLFFAFWKTFAIFFLSLAF